MSTTGHIDPVVGSSRLHSLDGLRGIAAFVVLAHHAFLMIPAFSATYGDGTGVPRVGSFIWWMSYSPLKLLTAGGEAVIVFFILSGIVLTRSVIERSEFNWIAYYPERVMRLWLPVVASVALAGFWIVLVPQVPFEKAATWLSSYSTPHPALAQFVSAINIFDHGSVAFHVNNPLWSLSWELAFSLALPVFVVLAIGLKRWWILTVVVITVLTAVGQLFNSELLEFLPTFLIGALVAANFRELKALGFRLSQRRFGNLVWSVALVVGSLLVVSSWLVTPWAPASVQYVRLLHALSPLGAALIVIVCVGWTLLERMLSLRLFRWAGRVSFSLYLVHAPVLIFTAYLLRGMDVRFSAVVGATLATLVGWGFYVGIESRLHCFARWVGRRASASYLRFVVRHRPEPT